MWIPVYFRFRNALAMRAIRVREQGNSYLLRKKVNKVLFQKAWGSVGNPEDFAYMSLVASKADREIKDGEFQGFDKWFQDCETWDTPKLISAIEKLKQSNNTIAVLKHLTKYKTNISTPSQLDAFLNSLMISEPTKARYLSIFRKVAPMVTEKLSYSQSKGKPDPFQKNELNAILKSCVDMNRLVEFAFIDFWVSTGLRTGEIAALQYDWIDWENKKLQVKGTWSRQDKKTKECKSGHNRVIPLSKEAITCLKQRTNGNNRDFLFKFMQNPSNWISRQWAPLLKDAGVRYRKPYCLRHTCASQKIIDYKGDLARVAYEMGHRIDTLAEHYAGVIHQL